MECIFNHNYNFISIFFSFTQSILHTLFKYHNFPMYKGCILNQKETNVHIGSPFPSSPKCCIPAAILCPFYIIHSSKPEVTLDHRLGYNRHAHFLMLLEEYLYF